MRFHLQIITLILFATATLPVTLAYERYQEPDTIPSAPIVLVAKANREFRDTEERAAKDPAVVSGDQIDRFLTKIALENIPQEFEETKDWGGQNERWDGVEVWREGWKIETKRRKKTVNHGTWKKYRATLRNPEEEFFIQVRDFRESEEGKLVFDILVAAHLDIDARQAKWVKGVQLYSVNAEGSTKIRLHVTMEMDVKMGLNNFPPDVILVPRAQAAELAIEEFRIDRVSKIGGEVAQQITRGVRSKLDEKITEKEQKLVEKINKQLAKKTDDLRLSLADMMKSKWAGPLNKVLSKNPSAPEKSPK